MKKNMIVSGVIAAGLLVAGTASAATATTTFQVTANVLAKCLIDSASNLDFGDYTATGGDKSATSSIVLRCSKAAAYNLGLSAGTTAGGTIAQRLMQGPVDTLQYNLYQEAAHTTIWGDTIGTNTVTGTGAGIGLPFAITHTVYGLLPDNATNQNAGVGAYSDTITATVTY